MSRRSNDPRLLPTSRTWRVSTVRPSGNIFSAGTSRQNCTTPADCETKAGLPKASTVQARRELVITWNPQLKAFSASATACDGPKSGGSNPEIPCWEQVLGFPLPRLREASICKSGRADGSLDTELKTCVPTGNESVPGSASITS